MGPLLFIIYINDMPTSCKSAFVVLFADDSNLFYLVEIIDDLKNNQQ